MNENKQTVLNRYNQNWMLVSTFLFVFFCVSLNANVGACLIRGSYDSLLKELPYCRKELYGLPVLLYVRSGLIFLFVQDVSHIERLFTAAHHKKVWDHFTKAQRKNIEAWNKQSLEIKNYQLEDLHEKQTDDDEMEVSDDDEPVKKKSRDVSTDERNKLKDENDSLKCQVEAYKNEVEVLKMDYKKDLEDKEKQFKMLQQTLQGMQQQLMDARKKQLEEEQKVKELESKLKPNKSAKMSDKSAKLSDRSAKLTGKSAKISEVITLDDDDFEQSDIDSVSELASQADTNIMSDCDAKLVGIISTFLNVHPFGASLDYIWSYVSKVEPNLRPSDIESLMTRFPAVFKQELAGIGANIERKWIFNAFNMAPKISSSSRSSEIMTK